MALDERTDAKAGWSTMCRRGDHASCRTAQARCVCDCHGPSGQRAPERPKEAAVESNVTPLSSTKREQEHGCDQCDYTSFTEHGLAVHKARKHKAASSEKPTAKPRTPAPAKATDGRWAVLLLPPDDSPVATAVVLSSRPDADAVTDLLGALGHPAVAVRVDS